MNNEERHNSTKTEKNHSCKCYGDGNEDDWERSISYIFLDILGYSLIFLDMLGYSWILKNIFCDMQWQWQWGWLGELYQRSISYIFLVFLDILVYFLIFLGILGYYRIFFVICYDIGSEDDYGSFIRAQYHHGRWL